MSLAGERLPSILNPYSVRWSRVRPMNTGPALSSGPAQRVRSDAGHWVATFGRVFVRNATGLRQFNAFVTKVSINPAQVFHVPRHNCLTSPRRLAGVPRETNGVSFSDGATFDDESTFDPENIDFEIAATAARRATVLQVEAINGLAPSAGQSFTHWSAAGPYMYDIARVTDEGSNVYELQIWPPLRHAASPTDTVDFEDVVCSAIVTGGADGLEETLRRFGYADLEFTESWVSA